MIDDDWVSKVVLRMADDEDANKPFQVSVRVRPRRVEELDCYLESSKFLLSITSLEI